MKRRTFIRMGLIAIPIASTIIACENKPTPSTTQTATQSPTAASQVIKIGSILTLTGSAASIGQEILAGQKLAVEYWNAKGGTKVELVSEDSKNQPKDGLSAFQSLKARGYRIFTANGSGVSLALKPEINENESTLISLAAHPSITDPVKAGVFRYSSTAIGEAKVLLEWIKKSGSKDTVVIFHSVDDYGVAFAKAMEANLKTANIPTVVKGYRKEDLPEMRSLVQSALPTEKYIPIVVGTGQPMAQVISVIRTLRYQGIILANIGFALTGVQKQLGIEAGKVAYISLDISKTADTEWLEKEYNKIFNRELTPDAAIGFNSISLMVTACKKVKSSHPIKINPVLLEVAADYFSVKEAITNNEIIVGVKISEA